MRATMDDIAGKCGVSLMTVSRVFSGKDCVSEATREKVLEAAKLLNFEVNSMARNFAHSRSGFIGLVAPLGRLVGTEYFGEIVRGFHQVLEPSDRDLSLFDLFSPHFDEGGRIENLHRSRKVDGILVLAPHAKESFLDAFSHQNIPLVVVGKRVLNENICSIDCHDGHGIEALCEHLYALGHRKMAFIGGPYHFSVAQARERAYREFCRARGLSIPDAYIDRGDYTLHAGLDAGLRLLRLPDRPTAIVVANDLMAFGVMESARQLGLSIPKNLSIGGFDDLPSATDCFPPLTTVHQPVFEMAKLSAEILLDALDQDLSPQGRTTLEVSLVVRESTGPVS